MDSNFRVSEEFRYILQKRVKDRFGDYKNLKDLVFSFNEEKGKAEFIHIQGSPDASPASMLEVRIPFDSIGIKRELFPDDPHILAMEDFLARMFIEFVHSFTSPMKGIGGSGSWQPPIFPQEVIKHNVVNIEREKEEIVFWLRLSLAGENNKAYVDITEKMIMEELPRMFDFIKKQIEEKRYEEYFKVICDWFEISSQLHDKGLVAFVGEGSILPRESGLSDLPLRTKEVISFTSPSNLRVSFIMEDGREISGMGIPKGITLIVGGGFHGKSTLLNAIVRGIYPHIPGDGREYVVTRKDAVFLKAEDGRSVRKVNISSFIKKLPGGKDTVNFSTDLASGSTSQAASLVEAVTGGSRLLLFDEDSSAINFLIKDAFMKRLVTSDPISPLVERALQLKKDYDISLIIVAGGSSMYFEIADTIIEMRDYLPYDVTAKAKSLNAPGPDRNVGRLNMKSERILLEDNFDPSYTASRHGKRLDVRIKSLRLEPKKVELGETLIDLSSVPTIVDSMQIEAVAWALYKSRKDGVLKENPITVEKLSMVIDNWFKTYPLSWVCDNKPLYLARPGRYEILAAINRLRTLKLK